MIKRKIKTVFVSAGIVFLLAGCAKNTDEKNTDTMMTTEETVLETILTETEITETEATETEEVTETVFESEPLIVVLDPGHDSEFCTRNHPDLGVNEQDLNLKIALACRERLEQYAGVTVYMTREDGSCPDAEHNGDYCIEARTSYATEKEADLFVSLHNNGTTGILGAEAYGSEVYVSNYSAYTEDSRRLGELILNNLEQFDLTPKGVYVRTKEEKGYYDDGSVQDWYYLISYSVEGGHPGIIIEHAYMDNLHDNAILKDDKILEAMGAADADAIAEYYQLELKH